MRHEDDLPHPDWPAADDPDCGVALFVQEGLDRARQQMAAKLQADEVQFCEYAAAVILDTRRRVIVDGNFAAFVHSELPAPRWATPDITQTLAELAADPVADILRDSWLRYATELELNREAVGRASLAWERFTLLAPRLSRKALAPAARQLRISAMSITRFARRRSHSDHAVSCGSRDPLVVGW